MNPKIRKKSPIHENPDANITCDFGDGDISRSMSFLSNTCTTCANGRRRHDGTTEDGTTDSHVDFLNLIVDVMTCVEMFMCVYQYYMFTHFPEPKCVSLNLGDIITYYYVIGLSISIG